MQETIIPLLCPAPPSLPPWPCLQVFPEDRFMARLFTPEIAAFYEQFYAGGQGWRLGKGE